MDKLSDLDVCRKIAEIEDVDVKYYRVGKVVYISVKIRNKENDICLIPTTLPIPIIEANTHEN